MDPRQAYDQWASQYDQMQNRTRDLEASVLRSTLSGIRFDHILELGCGTGKNTRWLAAQSSAIIGLDYSTGMIERAQVKVPQATLVEADLTKTWPVESSWADLITCSLVLEHIEDLGWIFAEASRTLRPQGRFYLSELHPAKQYAGSRARFETDQGMQYPRAHIHHLSDYLQAGSKHGLGLQQLEEHFDVGREGIPRLLTLIFEKP